MDPYIEAGRARYKVIGIICGDVDVQIDERWKKARNAENMDRRRIGVQKACLCMFLLETNVNKLCVFLCIKCEQFQYEPITQLKWIEIDTFILRNLWKHLLVSLTLCWLWRLK